MKTRIFIVLSILLIATLLLSLPNLSMAQAKRISILTASTGGTWYLMGGAISKVINKYVPGVEATPEVTAGGLENIRLLMRGKADLILTSDAQILTLLKEPEKRKEAKFRALLTGISSTLQVVVNEDSPIHSIKDLKGKRMGTPSLNDGGEIMAKVALEAYGMSYKDAKSAKHLSLPELANAFKDGFVDVAFAGGGAPLSAVMDMTTSKKCRLLPMDRDKVEWIINKYPGYTPTVVFKGIYRGVDKDLPSFGTRTGLFVLASTDETLAYQITKAVLEHTKELEEVHPQGRTYNIQETLYGLKSVPFHKGAIKYYREKGVWEKRPAGVMAEW